MKLTLLSPIKTLNKAYLKQSLKREQIEQFTADLYTYFYKTGLDILTSHGLLCYIAPNKFMRAGYGKNTRELLTTRSTPLMILDFGDLPIFDEAVTYPAIVLVEKLSPSPSTSLGDHAQGAAGETLGERSRTRSRTVTHPLPPSRQGRGAKPNPTSLPSKPKSTGSSMPCMA